MASSALDDAASRIIAAHCLSCHLGAEAKGGLDLSRRENAMAGSESGIAIVPGNVEESYLWDLIDSDQMPPDSPLSDAEKETLRQWILNGARWSADPIDPFAYTSDRRAGYDWWSLQPLTEPSVPIADQDNWTINEIDQFVFAKLQRLDLRPSPRAEPRTLVRRLYFDLIGLPAPTTVIDRFVANPSQEAYEELVAELLDSEHYGERWARHWMDVARFGESDGYEYNRPRENAWHYRDWLIRAFNRDLPYDQFARMQIAGDVLEPDSIAGASAVGFLVSGTHNTVLGVDPTMKLAGRHDELEELAGTVGQTFLGMTINCARCHDHKFDPITSREYYSFIAALNGIEHGEREFPASSDSWKERKQLADDFERVEKRLANQITSRGGQLSSSANVLRTKDPVNANVSNRKYRLTLHIAPTVWADASQATTDEDGILVTITNENGSVIVSRLFRPGPWNQGKDAHAYQMKSLEYEGDGKGAVHVQLSPSPLNSGRFGGAIDDLSIAEVDSGTTIFRELFDDFQTPNPTGEQADTRRRVIYGAISASWVHSGTNSIHAVEYTDKNLAVQLFAGTGGSSAIEVETEMEKELLNELQALERQQKRLASTAVYTVLSGSPSVMHVYQRGDISKPGEEVAPGGIAAIKNTSADFSLDQAASDTERRRQLASWMTQPENALFHRVAVNRIWHYHFGQGIVTTPSDFGFNGSLPSHPELLDWLSIWFREQRYSMKALHRLIVTSATYQQASLSRDDGKQVDQDNRFLWRQNPRRLEAEILRDSILFSAGQLNTQKFGPGYRDVEVVEVPPAFYYSPIDPDGHSFNRRTIYRWNVRGQRSALLDTFDCPDPSTKTPNRLETTTPSQALSQWNDDFVLRMSERLAKSIQVDAAEDVAAQVQQAWRRTLGRMPTDEENKEAVQLVNKHGLTLLCRVLFNSNEFILID